MTDRTTELPDSYRRALALRSNGSSDADIASSLAVPVESVAAIVEIAEAKLARIEDGANRGGTTDEL